MTRPHPLALALLAMLCLGITLTTPAAAATKKGEFVGPGNVSLAGTKFTTRAGQQGFEVTSGVNVKCESATGSGEILSKTSATYQILFKGCKKSTGGTCKTAGAPAEEVRAPNLLVDVVRAPGGQTDLLLEQTSSVVEFECASVKQKVRGAYLFAVGATFEGSLHKEFIFSSKQSKGQQEFSEFENGSGATVKGVTLEADFSNEGYKNGALTGETELTFTTGEGDFI